MRSDRVDKPLLAMMANYGAGADGELKPSLAARLSGNTVPQPETTGTELILDT